MSMHCKACDLLLVHSRNDLCAECYQVALRLLPPDLRQMVKQRDLSGTLYGNLESQCSSPTTATTAPQ